MLERYTRNIRNFFSEHMYILCLSALCCLNSCTSVDSRASHAENLIKKTQFSTQVLQTRHFEIFSSHKVENFNANNILTIVIEGDGYSWVNRYKISDNPTPRNPVGLKIATSLNKPVVYLARPCQYVTSADCTQPLWSSGRFKEEVILSYMDALDSLSAQYQNRQFNLIGFSGGAYIALVLAAKREDISSVSTIAGVLDPENWTRFHQISPLSLYYETADLLRNSDHVSFEHICSRADKIMPCALTENFVHRSRGMGLVNHRATTYDDETHTSLWKAALKHIN